jgi:hypothetical protein
MVGGVPNLEPTPRCLEIGHERLVELLELFAELKDREIQPALAAQLWSSRSVRATEAPQSTHGM